jgi:AcrR family transcriptional regulator
VPHIRQYPPQGCIGFSNDGLKKGLGALMGPSEITQERILKTAVRLFADRGYEVTSIRTIAARANVNQAAINYHFKSKDGLYREVLRRALRALTEHFPTPKKHRRCRVSRRSANLFVNN